METARVDGVKAPQHRETPRSHLDVLRGLRLAGATFTRNDDALAVLLLRHGAEGGFRHRKHVGRDV